MKPRPFPEILGERFAKPFQLHPEPPDLLEQGGLPICAFPLSPPPPRSNILSPSSNNCCFQGLLASGHQYASIVLGQDMSIGFIGPSGEKLECSILESLALHIRQPQAICILKE